MKTIFALCLCLGVGFSCFGKNFFVLNNNSAFDVNNFQTYKNSGAASLNWSGAVPAGSSATSSNSYFGVSSLGNYLIMKYKKTSSGPQYTCPEVYYIMATNGVTYTFSTAGGDGYFAQASWQNGDTFQKNWDIFTNGVYMTSISVPPGGRGSWSLQTPEYVDVVIQGCGPDGTAIPGDTVFVNYATGEAAYGATEVRYGVPNDVKYTGTVSNIVGNTDIGASAIYDAISKLAGQLHTDIEGISVGGGGGGTGDINLSITNVPGTNYQPSFDYLTNYLGGIRTNAGNFLTNLANSSEYGISTNEGAVIGYITNGMGEVTAKGNAIVEAIGEPGLFEGAGAPTDFWEFKIFGQKYSWNPEQYVPGIWNLLKTAATWVLLIEFAWFLSRTFFKVVSTMGAETASSKGGVGNVAMLLGLFLNPFTVIPATFAYLLLPLGIFTVFGWLISWFIDYGLEYLGQIASSNGWLQFAGVQATLYLVDLTFPVNLFLTLLFLRFTITIVAAYSTLAAGAFLKMLGSMNVLPF